MSRQNLSWHAQIAFDRQAIKICSLGALDNMRKYKILASNKPCDDFNWMSHKKFNIYKCKPVLRTYMSLASSPPHLLRNEVKVIMTGRWPKVTFNLCPKIRSIKIDLSLNPIRHAPDSNQNKKQVRSYR